VNQSHHGALGDFCDERDRLDDAIAAAAAGDVQRLRAHALERPNARFGLGLDDTPLSAAARAGSLEVVLTVLELNLADPQALDRSGRSPLTLAAKLGRAALIPALIQACPSPPSDRLGQSPLTAAASENHPDALMALLDAFSPLDVDGAGFDALSRACLAGSNECAAILAPLSNLEARLTNGRGALDLAVEFNHARCAAMLAPLSSRPALALALDHARKPLSMLAARDPKQIAGREGARAALEEALAAFEAQDLRASCQESAPLRRPRRRI
jgi:hypothetical protein